MNTTLISCRTAHIVIELQFFHSLWFTNALFVIKYTLSEAKTREETNDDSGKCIKVNEHGSGMVSGVT